MKFICLVCDADCEKGGISFRYYDNRKSLKRIACKKCWSKPKDINNETKEVDKLDEWVE